MVYYPRITFKTGVFPSLVRSFPADGKYAGTQRLLLSATRIFGTKIGGTMRSGVSPFRQLRMGRQLLVGLRTDPQVVNRYWPSMIEKEEADFKRITTIQWKEEREKLRARRKKK